MVRILLLLLLMMQLPAVHGGGLPAGVTYQGQLTHVGGGTVTGSHRFEMRLYAAETGGAPMWSEVFEDVLVDRGLFTLTLGTQDPAGLAAVLQGESDLWLSIRVGDGEEMAPRQRLTYVPSAIHADRAGTLEAGTLTGAMVLDGSIGLDKLALACQDGDTLVMAPTGWACGRKGCVPADERCDGVDNDCDGDVDEPFTDLGSACSAGVGACSRFGQRVCAQDGAGSVCAATAGQPGVEICDSIDNDCNDIVDDGFRNPGSGAYDTIAACGSCAKDCTAIPFPNGVPSCVGSNCSWSCSPGTVNVNGDVVDGCECTVQPGTDSVGDRLDQNCDGVDGDVANSILVGGYLATDWTGCGGRNSPCRTITYGRIRAQATGRAVLLVAAGLYPEAIDLVPGISLFGSYLPDFSGRSESPLSIIAAPPGAASGAIRCNSLAGAAGSVRVEGFEIIAADATAAGASTYAVHARSCSNALSLRHNWLRAGRAGDGTAGTSTTAGQPGLAGASGSASFDTQHRCVVQDHRSGGAGGSSACTGSPSGGAGGARICPAESGGSTAPPTAAEAGQPAAAGGASGGAAGRNLYVRSGQCGLAQVFDSVDGRPGAAGVDGSAGEMGAGCSTPQGTVIGGLWTPGAASSGGKGADGAGGGGGGSGAGAFVDMSCFGSLSVGDVMGATGGGGGAGGCGGTGGDSGMSAGSSFAVFMSYDSPPASMPTLTDNVIYIGRGGVGGNGGVGPAGGAGGPGGAAGSNTLFAAGAAADGGRGGRGGAGGGGGGGCGGSAWGVFVHGVAGPASFKTSNIFVPGLAGAGGRGGTSTGNTGAEGADGLSANANY